MLKLKSGGLTSGLHTMELEGKVLHAERAKLPQGMWGQARVPVQFQNLAARSTVGSLRALHRPVCRCLTARPGTTPPTQ